MTQTKHTRAASTDEYAGTPRYIWQSLFVLVSTIRPEWPMERIENSVFSLRRERSFPEISAVAVKVASDPRFKGPGAIRMAGIGMIAL